MTEDHVHIKDKYPRRRTNVEMGNLLSKELKIMIITMIKKLRRRMDEQNEKSDVFNKELKNKERNQRI